MKYVALLRGINVGGRNIIRMAALKVCLEQHGFRNVATFIQSGNVIFESDERNAGKLTTQIEGALSKMFDYDSRVVLRSHAQLKAVVVIERFERRAALQQLVVKMQDLLARMKHARIAALMESVYDGTCLFLGGHRRLFPDDQMEAHITVCLVGIC